MTTLRKKAEITRWLSVEEYEELATLYTKILEGYKDELHATDRDGKQLDIVAEMRCSFVEFQITFNETLSVWKESFKWGKKVAYLWFKYICFCHHSINCHLS